MIVGVPREFFSGERRVALVPAVLPSLAKVGLAVIVEASAGAQAGYPDADFAAKDAKIVADRAEVFRAADIVVQVPASPRAVSSIKLEDRNLTRRGTPRCGLGPPHALTIVIPSHSLRAERRASCRHQTGVPSWNAHCSGGPALR